MTLTPQMLWIVCPLALLAGFVDSVAGGGGLISLPSYYLAGLPPALAAGTNKLSSGMGALLATVSYGKAGRIQFSIGGVAAGGAFLCSALGAFLLKQLPAETVRWLVMGCVPIAAVFTLRGGKLSDLPPREWTLRQQWLLSFCIGCGSGFYDGLIGPGTGTFLILLFMYVFRMETVMSSGTAKLVNLSSNAAALLSLLTSGDVLFLLGLPAGLCAMAGAFVGSRLTLQKGSRMIRGMMMVVLGLLLAKLLTDMIG